MRIPVLVLCLSAALPAASQAPPHAERDSAATSPPARPTAAEAKAFVDQVNSDLKRLWIRSGTADWIKATYITDDAERNAAALNEDVMAYLSRAIRDSVRFDGVTADPDPRRMLYLLRIASPLPAPTDPAKRSELAGIAAKLEGIYGKGKVCEPIRGKDGRAVTLAKGRDGGCRDLQDLSEILAKSRDPDALLAAWVGWHRISREMKPLYARMVELSNEGAHEIGFHDTGELWRDGYDMTPAEFEAEEERLWQEVKPLYAQLHCYVRAKLQKVYGKDRVPDGRPIPAHLLGNMWAQSWENLYPLVEPYPGASDNDVDRALKAQKKWDPIRMVKTGEAFFTSLGFDPLPRSFWERAMFTKPRDREVVCHASAWDVTWSADLRIKMCIRPLEEDLVTIHHERGHNFYQRAYVNLPTLFASGANDGFHEAIGDAIALSITPAYLKSLGLIERLPGDDRGAVDFQMKKALE